MTPISPQEQARIKAEHNRWLWVIALGTLAGGVLGVCVAWAIIYFDVGNLGSMLARSNHRIGYTALLTAGFASLFGMTVAGAAIMYEADRPREN